MIVDDSIVVRRKIHRSPLVSDADCVIQAKNGREAIDMFSHEHPDFVTMDLTMPLIDGVECVKELVAINPNVLILIISALSDKSTALKAIRFGARGFLSKPFTEEQLDTAIGKLLRMSKERL